MPHRTVSHRTMPHVMMRTMVHHRAVGASHSPAAKAAEGEDPRAIVTIERAAEQPANKRQYQNEYDQSEHCKLLSQLSAAIHAAVIKKRGFHHSVCRIKVSPVMLSRVIIGSPY